MTTAASLTKAVSSSPDRTIVQWSCVPECESAPTVGRSRACHYFLDPLIDHLDGLSAEEGEEYRKLYGSGAGLRYFRRLQQALREARPKFNPAGVDDWLKAQDKEFNAEARDIVSEIEEFLKSGIRSRLEDEHGSDWERLGIPKKVRAEIAHRATDKNLELPKSKHVDDWDMMYLIDYRDLLTQNHDLWTRRFEKRYTKPGDENKTCGWKARTSWMVDLNEARNDGRSARKRLPCSSSCDRGSCSKRSTTTCRLSRVGYRTGCHRGPKRVPNRRIPSATGRNQDTSAVPSTARGNRIALAHNPSGGGSSPPRPIRQTSQVCVKGADIRLISGPMATDWQHGAGR